MPERSTWTTTGRPGYRQQQRQQAAFGQPTPGWRGSNAPEDHTLYPPNWRELSAEIRRRDGYRCQIGRLKTGCRCDAFFPPPFSHLLHVHHIVPLPQGSNLPRNLVTLCTDHHSEVHGRRIGRSPTLRQRLAARVW